MFSHSVKTLFIAGVTLANCSDALIDGEDFAVMTGTMPSSQRDAFLARFNDPYDPMRILFLSHRSFDVGTQLTGGSRVILYDVSHRLHDDAQAIFRVFRIGQQHPSVHVVQLVMANRIEQQLSGVGAVLEERRKALVAMEAAAAATAAAEGAGGGGIAGGKKQGTRSSGRLSGGVGGGGGGGAHDNLTIATDPLDVNKAIAAEALMRSIVEVPTPPALAPSASSTTAATTRTATSLPTAAESRALLLNVIEPLSDFAACDPLLVRAICPSLLFPTRPQLRGRGRRQRQQKRRREGGSQRGSTARHRSEVVKCEKRRSVSMADGLVYDDGSLDDDTYNADDGTGEEYEDQAEEEAVPEEGGCEPFLAHIITEQLL